MPNFLVVYGSRYGSTEKYARFIAERLGGAALPAEKTKAADLKTCNAVIFGGGVYAGKIAGWKRASRLIRKAGIKRLVLFVCGLADPARQKTRDEAKQLFCKRLPAEAAQKTPVFCLRGGMDYAKLNFTHRTMMAMLLSFLRRKKERSEEDEKLLQSYGKKIDFYDEQTALPVVSAAENL